MDDSHLLLVLIDANRMLKSLQDSDPKEKTLIEKRSQENVAASEAAGRDEEEEDHSEGFQTLMSGMVQHEWGSTDNDELGPYRNDHWTTRNDLGTSGLLLRLAFDGLCLGWLGGPPCRTRSMLNTFHLKGSQCRDL